MLLTKTKPGLITQPQSDPTLDWFLSHCHSHKYPPKSVLIHVGESANTLYFIVKGSVAVVIKDDEGKEMILSYLNQNDFIGELALFDKSEQPIRSASVKDLIKSFYNLLQLILTY